MIDATNVSARDRGVWLQTCVLLRSGAERAVDQQSELLAALDVPGQAQAWLRVQRGPVCVQR